MNNTLKKFSLISVFMFFLIACSAIQISLQVNIPPLTPTMMPTILASTPQPSGTSSPTITYSAFTGTPVPTWTALSPLPKNQSFHLTGLNMLSETTGWGIEAWGHVVHTVDGGKTWRDVTPPQASYIRKRSFFSTDPNQAWAASDGITSIRTWHTLNAGQDWEVGNTIDLNTLDITPCESLHFSRSSVYQLHFIDSRQGWMLVKASADGHAGYVSLLFATQDAGMNWELRHIATTNCSSGGGLDGLSAVLFLNPLDGFGGFSSRRHQEPPHNQIPFLGGWDIYITQDGGRNWQRKGLSAPSDFLDAASKRENDWEYASCGVTKIVKLYYSVYSLRLRCFIPPNNSYSFYYLTFDNGTNWTFLELNNHEELFFSEIYDNDRVILWRFLAYESDRLNEIEKSIDNGKTWTVIKKVEWKFAQLHFVTENFGWALVTDEAGKSVFVRTTNGGRTWTLLNPIIKP
ncbi:MAG: hypothetical protein B6I38_06665 [Anaerolineaceae bacterium 4572_5.1]|nr:MAG: hypothetical protein B6I38_06665 [Anaerolineaceae bacterium 4572_5.1]